MILSFSRLERRMYDSHHKFLDRIKSFQLDPDTGCFFIVMGQKSGYVLQDCLYQEYLILSGTGASEIPHGQGIDLIGLQVVTEQGTRLGNVNDFYFDTDLFQLVRFSCSQKLFKFIPRNRIIGSSSIVRITHQKIVVRDNVQLKQEKASASAIEVSPA